LDRPHSLRQSETTVKAPIVTARPDRHPKIVGEIAIFRQLLGGDFSNFWRTFGCYVNQVLETDDLVMLKRLKLTTRL
jgi:hypothetical protein